MKITIFTAMIALLLTACGGGGGSSSGNTHTSTADTNSTLALQPHETKLLAQALISGDPTGLTDAKLIAQSAKNLQQQISTTQTQRISRLYEGVSSEYDPSQWSHWIRPKLPSLAQPLIVGDLGNYLAGISIAGPGRSAAYGVGLLEWFSKNQQNNHGPAFKRLLSWLVNGDAAEALPPKLKIAFSGLDAATALLGLQKVNVSAESVSCDLSALDCIGKANLLILGADMNDNALLEKRIRTLIASGMPVLYFNTKGNLTTNAGRKVLSAMELEYGADPGNYVVKDKVSQGRSVEKNIALSDQFTKTRKLIEMMASETYSFQYDWSSCVWNDCSSVPGLVSDFGTPVEELRQQVNAYNASGKNIFTTSDNEVLRYLVLWADVIRNSEISYPMDKVSTPTSFQKAFIADALVAYIRSNSLPQRALGTFAGQSTQKMDVSTTEEIVDVTLTATSGFTAVGRAAAPGKKVSVELIDAGNANVALRFNTQRPGSTKLFEANSYTRPRFLTSPDFPLKTANPMQMVSPYGGPMQLVFNNATPQQVVRLRITGVAKHPFLDQSRDDGDIPAFVAALNSNKYDFIEIKLPGIELHSRADMTKAAIFHPMYGGKGEKYISELKTLLFEDAYLLAGFPLSGKNLTIHVQNMCNSLNWNCTDSTIHRPPSTQHINVDTYAACGQACSGNPYDQQFAVNPRGLPESHELGHNLQENMHKVYGDKSTEVSNNLFPIHKTWRMFVEGIDSNPEPTTQYRSAFDLIKSSKGDADSITGAMRRIWSDPSYAAKSGERTTFYLQWVHYWAQRQASTAAGWDIVTLLYLHQRQFEALTQSNWAANREKLGYSTYAIKPAPTGEDNLLIALSWITGRDQRPTFDLWGIRYSVEADIQVTAFGFPVESAFFYANDKLRDQSGVRRVDMSVANPVWPFP
jgi:hypothetical protein